MDIKLGGLQRSVVDVEIIEGWTLDDEYADMVPDIAAHYRATGRLLVRDARRLARALNDIANAFDAQGDRKMEQAAFRLSQMCWKLHERSKPALSPADAYLRACSR